MESGKPILSGSPTRDGGAIGENPPYVGVPCPYRTSINTLFFLNQSVLCPGGLSQIFIKANLAPIEVNIVERSQTELEKERKWVSKGITEK